MFTVTLNIVFGFLQTILYHNIPTVSDLLFRNLIGILFRYLSSISGTFPKFLFIQFDDVCLALRILNVSINVYHGKA